MCNIQKLRVLHHREKEKSLWTVNLSIILIELGFNDTSTLAGHPFVSSPREREKRFIVLGFNNMSILVGHFVSRKMNEIEDTEEIQHSPSTHTCCKDSRPCPAVSQYQRDALVTQDTRHLCHTQPPPREKRDSSGDERVIGEKE